MNRSSNNPFAAADERGISQADKLLGYKERKERLAKFKEESKVVNSDQGNLKNSPSDGVKGS